MFWANQLHCTNVFMKSSAISLYQPSRAAKQITFSLKTFSGSRSWWLSAGKESACNAGDSSSISGSGRSPREGIGYPLQYSWASLVAQMVKNPPAMQETWVRSLGWEDPPWRRERLHTPVFWPGEKSMGCVAKSQTRQRDFHLLLAPTKLPGFVMVLNILHNLFKTLCHIICNRKTSEKN